MCGQFTVPGNSAPLPPDSLEIEVGWRVIAPRWNGDSTVVGVYLAHVPTVESWTLSVDDAGAWRGVQTVPNVLYPLGTPQGVASQQFPCETHYTYTGDPQRPANGGPWADGSDWQCAFDVDPYFATSWVFPRRPVTYAVRTRLDGYDAEGKLVAAWAGEWEIRARS